MHRMHIINAILNYKKMQTRGAIFGWERLCIVDRRFYFDGGDFVSIQSLRREISYQSRGDSVSGETLFRDTGCAGCLSLDVLHWLPLLQRIMFRIGAMVWRCILGLAPAYLRDLCCPTPGTRGRSSLRSSRGYSL